MGKSSTELKNARNNLIAKDTRMIQNSRQELTMLENKAILYMISKICPTDKPGKVYIFDCQEFQELLKWNSNNCYAKIKAMLTRLGDKSWWIKTADGKEALVRWFNTLHIDPGTAQIEVTWHEDTTPYLLDLQRRRAEDGTYFTTYRLQNITLMKHKYSPRIYELLKSYQFNNVKWTFEIGTGSDYDLQVRIANTKQDAKTRKCISVIPASWSNWAVFKRDVIEPAVEEINKYTDIKVAYRAKKEDLSHKSYRSIKSIEFYMVKKTPGEQKKTNQIIDDEYYDIIDPVIQAASAKQMSLEEFLTSHKDLQDQEDEERRYEERSKRPHALITESVEAINGGKLEFSEKQIDSLYETSLKYMTPYDIDVRNYELFATDLISYYYKLILAYNDEDDAVSKEKKGKFARLQDMIANDYKQYVPYLQNMYVA